MTIRPFPRSGRRNLIDVASALAEKDNYAVVCVSRGALNIIRKLAYPRGEWNTSYAKSYTQVGYEPATDVDMDVIDEILSEFMEATEVNCNELLDELTAIGAAITASGGQGGCGCGTTGTGADESQGTEDTGQILDLGEDTPPGFSDRQEYVDYKCDVATWIVDSHIADLAWLKTQSLVALSALFLIAAFITPIPGDEILALLVLLVALSGLGSNLIDYAYDAMINNYDDLVCDLFNNPNAADSESDWTATMSTAIDAEIANIAIRAYLKAIVGYFLTNGQLNKLYNRDAALIPLLPTGDCDACGTPCSDHMITGSGDFDALTFSSASFSTGHRISFVLAIPRSIDVDSMPGWVEDPDLVGANNFRIASTQDSECGNPTTVWDLYDSDVDPTGSTFNPMGRIDFRGDVAFTLNLSDT